MTQYTKQIICSAIFVLFTSGCAIESSSFAQLPPPTFNSAPPVSTSYVASNQYAQNASCELVGAVMATADCDCYDKMSYERVKSLASQNLRDKAEHQFPAEFRLEISAIDLYLNNAVASGLVYDCSQASI